MFLYVAQVIGLSGDATYNASFKMVKVKQQLWHDQKVVTAGWMSTSMTPM